MVSTRRETLRWIAASALAGTGLVGRAAAQAKPVRLAMVVRLLGTGVAEATHRGGTEAATALGDVDLSYAGPVKGSAEEQVQIVDGLVAQRVDAILIAPIESAAVAAACRKAVQRGIKVVAFETALAKDARTLQVESSRPSLVGPKLIKMMAQAIGHAGDVAILSTTAQAPGPNATIAEMKREWIRPDYDRMKLAAVAYGAEAPDTNATAARGLLTSFPNLKGIVAPTPVGLAAAAKAVLEAGLAGKVRVTGIGAPSEIKAAVQAGVVDSFAILNPVDLGSAVVTLASMLANGQATAEPGATIKAGRLGDLTVGPDGTIAVGEPTVVDRSNLASFADLF